MPCTLEHIQIYMKSKDQNQLNRNFLFQVSEIFSLFPLPHRKLDLPFHSDCQIIVSFVFLMSTHNTYFRGEIRIFLGQKVHYLCYVKKIHALVNWNYYTWREENPVWNAIYLDPGPENIDVFICSQRFLMKFIGIISLQLLLREATAWQFKREMVKIWQIYIHVPLFGLLFWFFYVFRHLKKCCMKHWSRLHQLKVGFFFSSSERRLLWSLTVCRHHHQSICPQSLNNISS